MIAAFELNGFLHIVLSVARKGLKAQMFGYCKVEGNAADGTIQVPDWFFDGRPTAPPTFASTRICPVCAQRAKEMREPPPPPAPKVA